MKGSKTVTMESCDIGSSLGDVKRNGEQTSMKEKENQAGRAVFMSL